ncbi:Mucin-like protein, partial [Phytophthora palmivora]
MFECSGIFEAIGGAPNSTDETSLTFDGVNATGYAVNGAPYQEDDYIVRDDLSSKSVPSAASFGTFQSVVATSSDYATFLEGIQYGVHNEVLDAVGGAFSTAAAARDVLYYSWYSALDMYLHVYHLCRIGVPLTYDQIIESLEVYSNATQTCGGVDGVDAESAIIMRINVDGEVVDASQHPTLGQYFGYVGSDNWNYVDIQQLGDYSYTYQLPEILRQQILSNNDMCTGFNRAFAASYTTLNAAAVKSTTTTKTTTKTTTTKTTKIVNGKKVTTTKVTKVVTRSNSTSSSSAKSTVTRGQLVSSYGYTYLGNFSTDSVAYGEGTIVTNG